MTSKRTGTKPLQKVLDENAPWLPPTYELADVTSLQALFRGEANADQQKRALDWIINKAAHTYEPSYRAGNHGERDTCFAEGKRFVGIEIVKMLKMNVSQLRRNDELA